MAAFALGAGENGWLIVLTIVMMALIFIGLWGLSVLRGQVERELRLLYQQNVELYLERLEHNKLLGVVFRKPVLLLYRLEGYMKQGDDEAIRRTIAQLDRMNLPPRDRVQFYQQRLSFFASAGDGEQARASRDALAAFLKKSKADRVERYQAMLQDADQIVSVYVDRDTSLIPVLREQAAQTADLIQRGVLQYRLAKLYHFAGDGDMVQVYLKRAGKNLKKTAYEVMIKAALEDHSALERQ